MSIQRDIWLAAKAKASELERAYQAAEAECDRLHKLRMEANQVANACFNEYLDDVGAIQDPVNVACAIIEAKGGL